MKTYKQKKRELDRDLILSRKYQKRVVQNKKNRVSKRHWRDERILDEEEYL